MRIIGIEAQNVMKLKAVRFKPGPGVNVIGGKNGAGKSTLLNSVAMAFGGKALVPAEPVRTGQKKGRVTVDVGDWKITRTFKPDGSSAVTLANADGLRASSPQKILAGFYGDLTFNPLAFATMPGPKQLDTLKSLVPQVAEQIEDIEAKRECLYDQRHEANRDRDRLKARLEAMPEVEDAPAEPVDVSAAAEELEAIQEHNQGRQYLRAAMEHCIGAGMAAKAIVERVEEELAEARAELEACEIRYKCDALDLKAMGNPKDPAPVREQLANAEATNAAYRTWQDRTALVEEYKVVAADAEHFDGEVKDCDAAKREVLASAKLPVDGLEFGVDGLLYQGVPFEQASQAEKLRVSVAMGCAMNPELRVMLIQDASLLDEDNMALLAEMAEEYDMQMLVERVGKEGASVIIEDGEVAE